MYSPTSTQISESSFSHQQKKKKRSPTWLHAHKRLFNTQHPYSESHTAQVNETTALTKARVKEVEWSCWSAKRATLGYIVYSIVEPRCPDKPRKRVNESERVWTRWSVTLLALCLSFDRTRESHASLDVCQWLVSTYTYIAVYMYI